MGATFGPMMGSVAADRPWLPRRGVVAVGLAYAALAASLPAYSWPMRAATAAVCASVVVDALRHGWLRRWHRPPIASTGRDALLIVVWLLLCSAVVVFQVAMYVSSPRVVYPTLSSLAGDAFAVWPVRVAAFALWMWVGWYLVRR